MKERFFKRILSVLLCTVMVLGCMSSFVFADDSYQIVPAEVVEEAPQVDEEEVVPAEEIVEETTQEAELVGDDGEMTWSSLNYELNYGSDTTITLTNNVIAESGDVGLLLDVDRTVIIDLNGHNIDRNLTSSASDGYVIRVNSGKLTVKDSKGGGKITGGYNKGDGGGVLVDYTGSFTLQSGEIANNKSESSGAGVAVYSETAKFGMNDGSITANEASSQGGGLYLKNGSATITGGTIAGNKAGMYGGGVSLSNGTCTIISSSITGNESDVYGGGVYVSSACTLRLFGESVIDISGNENDDNLYLKSGAVISVLSNPVSGSKIYLTTEEKPSDSSLPVRITSGAYDWSSCFISQDEDYILEWNYKNAVVLKVPGTGISTWDELQEALKNGGSLDYDYDTQEYYYSIKLGGDIEADKDDTTLEYTFTDHPVVLDLYGHMIDRQLSDYQSDGAVLYIAKDSTLILRDSVGGGKITGGYGNGYGGGVNVYGTFIMESGSISGNHTQNDRGSGVYVTYGAVFTMKDGSITGNTGVNTDGAGVANGGTFNMEGGEITGNTTDGYGAGVYNLGTFNVSGDARVTGNTNIEGTSESNVCVWSSPIKIAGSLTSKASIGISMDPNGTFTEGYLVHHGKAKPSTYFTSDSGYCVYADESGEAAIRTEHDPGNMKWDWEDPYHEASLYVKCLECGTVLWSEEATIADPVLDKENLKVKLTATVIRDGETYSYLKEFYATYYMANEPKLDADGNPVNGNIAYYSAEVGDTTYYFDENGNLISEEDTILYYVEEKLPEFKSHSLILDGQIGVNFFLDLPEISGVDYSDSYVEFTVNGKTDTVQYDPSFRDENGRGYYGFTAHVNSIQMAEIITAVFHYGDNQTVEDEFSVKEYVEFFDDNMDLFTRRTVIIVKSLADYGHYAQLYLSDVRKWTIGVDYAEMDKFYTNSDAYDVDTIKRSVKDYALVFKNESADFKKISYSLRLDSKTLLYLYFTVDADFDGTITATMNGKQVTAEKLTDTIYRIQTDGIPAHKLGESYDFVVTSPGGTATMTVSAMSYVHALINSNSVSENAENILSSLYYFFQAADLMNS